MKKAFLLIALLLGLVAGAEAQNTLNNDADAIVGTYSGKQGSDNFRAKITRLKNGTYQAQITWVEHDRDSKGNKLLDSKNPDKKLRSTPCDRIVLFFCYNFEGLQSVEFVADGRLKLKGSLMGISESVYWTKVK